MTRKTSAYARRLQKDQWGRIRHKSINPVAEMVMRERINADMYRLRTSADMHAWAGENAKSLVNLAGRLMFIASYAARFHELDGSPEARILASTTNALADLASRPDTLEQQRASIQGGLLAVDRLMPSLSTWALTAGALELDALLQKTQGMDTEEIRNAHDVEIVNI